MKKRLAFHATRLRERLWTKPLVYCLAAVLAAFVARLADAVAVSLPIPTVSPETIEKLLTIISSTMLAVATFAVGSMVSAYASASRTATPRAFAVVLADDTSQTALSSFIGAFIFSIVAIIAVKTDFYGVNGHFLLFVLTLAIFAWVVLTFVRWVDTIARLGRLGPTIDKVEAAAHRSIERRRQAPRLGGVAPDGDGPATAPAVHAARIGYVQYIDMDALQAEAEAMEATVRVDALPGSFLSPDKPLAHITTARRAPSEDERSRLAAAFVIGDDRTFDEDPRFGLIVLSEIAARALSPAVNDHGTAIVIVGRLVRLFAHWTAPADDDAPAGPTHDRVAVPALCMAEMFDDAFSVIARDGAGSVEVGIRLQKAFRSLASLGDDAVRTEARRHSALALARAEQALCFPDDLSRLREAARGVGD